MITNAISAYRVGQNRTNKPQNQNFKGAREVEAAYSAIDTYLTNDILSRKQQDSSVSATVMKLMVTLIEKVYKAAGFEIERMVEPTADRILTFTKGKEKVKLNVSRFDIHGMTLTDGSEILNLLYKEQGTSFKVEKKGGAINRATRYKMPWTKTRK